jgi:RNA polymerase sigma-70 factor (ECF subfamily)
VTTERTHGIVAALRRMSPEYRETVLLRFYCDMTRQEIAHALDVPVGTVKSICRERLTAVSARTQVG